MAGWEIDWRAAVPVWAPRMQRGSQLSRTCRPARLPASSTSLVAEPTLFPTPAISLRRRTGTSPAVAVVPSSTNSSGRSVFGWPLQSGRLTRPRAHAGAPRVDAEHLLAEEAPRRSHRRAGGASVFERG